ncbi:hypothetical protein H0H92_009278, partial [Tricholoma furcatifolium]
HLATLVKTWTSRWKTSERYGRIQKIDKTLPSKSYIRLISSLNRNRSALLTQLRRKAESLPYLVSKPDALKHLFRYIQATQRIPVAPSSTQNTGA